MRTMSPRIAIASAAVFLFIAVAFGAFGAHALKAKLAAEGLFAVERKRDLPRLPRHLAIVTSPAAAALRDVLTVLRRRCPVLQVTVLPVAVQGPDAQRSIVNALKRLARWPKHIGRAAPEAGVPTAVRWPTRRSEPDEGGPR